MEKAQAALLPLYLQSRFYTSAVVLTALDSRLRETSLTVTRLTSDSRAPWAKCAGSGVLVGSLVELGALCW